MERNIGNNIQIRVHAPLVAIFDKRIVDDSYNQKPEKINAIIPS